MMRRKSRAEQNQQEAHVLLLEWAAGPGEGVQEDGSIGERIHGGAQPMSAPERHTQQHHRWLLLNRAVRVVFDHDDNLGSALWWLYAEDRTPRDCAARMFGKDPRSEAEGERLTVEEWKAWADRRKSAAELFLRNYQMLCGRERESGEVTADYERLLTAT